MTMDLAYVLKQYDISNTAKIIWGILDSLSRASAKNGKPYIWISRKSIAERANVCVKTTIKAINELKTVGLIAEKRMGQGLNNHIFVFLPKTQEEEKQNTVETANHSIYNSRVVSNSIPYTNKEKGNNNIADISILPDNDTKGRTQPKGKPTPKKPRKNVEEQQRLRKHYREYFRKQLKYEEYKNDMLTRYEDADALAKIIDFMANTMANKGKIYINGTLLTPQQWYYMVKNISQDEVIEIIARIPKWQNVRKPQAYLLSCLYNSALHSTLINPWYSEA